MAENITAKIQVRRGELEDLPTLAEGEFGYALDYRRLFIGNTPITFPVTIDPDTGEVNRSYPIQDRYILQNQLRVLVNDTPVPVNISYPNESTTNINFDPAVSLFEGDLITASFNSEIVLQNNSMQTFTVPLGAEVNDFADTGVHFSTISYNTAFIDYSLKTSRGAFKVGTIKVIIDRNQVDPTASVIHVDESSSGLNGYVPIQFNGRVDSGNRFHLTYINTDPYPANFYYSVKLWNTI